MSKAKQRGLALLREIIKPANEDFYKESCLCFMWPELLQPNRKRIAHLRGPGMQLSSPQRVSDEIFVFNQGNEKITDGRYSLRRCLNAVTRKGEGVGINVNYTLCHQAYFRKNHQQRFRVQTHLL